MSTLGGYHEYIGGFSVHRGDIMMNVIFSNSFSRGNTHEIDIATKP